MHRGVLDDSLRGDTFGKTAWVFDFYKSPSLADDDVTRQGEVTVCQSIDQGLANNAVGVIRNFKILRPNVKRSSAARGLDFRLKLFDKTQ